jgi:hypothetical protein
MMVRYWMSAGSPADTRLEIRQGNSALKIKPRTNLTEAAANYEFVARH